MSDLEFGNDLIKLAELLKPLPEEEIEQKNYVQPSGVKNIQPQNVKISKSEEPKTIEEFEIQQEKEFEEAFRETRKEASYDIKYRQAVTPEDVYLQMGGKNPSTASCEDMIVTVQLPGEKYDNLELDVLHHEVKVKGASYKLDLPLPASINPDLSKANWDQINESLILTLRMERELDFINF